MTFAPADFSEPVQKNNSGCTGMKQFVNRGQYLEDDVRQRAKKGSPHFFDKDTMRFFSSRISELMWASGDRMGYQTNPIYFITSEADKGYYQHKGSIRAYTVRVIDIDGNIKTIGDFQGHTTLYQARKTIKELIGETLIN